MKSQLKKCPSLEIFMKRVRGFKCSGVGRESTFHLQIQTFWKWHEYVYITIYEPKLASARRPAMHTAYVERTLKDAKMYVERTLKDPWNVTGSSCGDTFTWNVTDTSCETTVIIVWRKIFGKNARTSVMEKTDILRGRMKSEPVKPDLKNGRMKSQLKKWKLLKRFWFIA